MPPIRKPWSPGEKSTEKIRILNSPQPAIPPASSLVMDVNMEIAQTYMADEKFRDALPYLANIINAEQGGGLKAKAYLKTEFVLL